MAIPFHAVGLAYRPGKNRGYVVVRFEVDGAKVLNTELVSPEPEAINFAAGRLRAECAAVLQAAREDAEVALAAKT